MEYVGFPHFRKFRNPQEIARVEDAALTHTFARGFILKIRRRWAAGHSRIETIEHRLFGVPNDTVMVKGMFPRERVGARLQFYDTGEKN